MSKNGGMVAFLRLPVSSTMLAGFVESLGREWNFKGAQYRSVLARSGNARVANRMSCKRREMTETEHIFSRENHVIYSVFY